MSLIESFDRYLVRNKSFTSTRKQSQRNRLKYAKKIVKASQIQDKQKRNTRLSKIEKEMDRVELMSDRDYLLARLRVLKS